MTQERSRPRKPRFLTFIMVVAAILGTLGMVMSAFFLAATAFVPGPYTVNGRPASFDEFMAFAVPVLGWYLGVSTTAIALSYGLRHDRLWTRKLLLGLAICLVVAPLLIAYLSGLAMGSALPRVVVAFVMLIVLWWQLYYDDDVLAYYSAVRDMERESRRPAPPS
jgi:hypothetical protein